MDKEILNDIHKIYYVVKRISEKYPNQQIGKTLIQKLFYLIVEKGGAKFDYSMYHYGPYSSTLGSYLSFADNMELLDIKWVEDKGYHISTKKELKQEELALDENFINSAEEIIRNYGNKKAIELSIIATGFFIKTHFKSKNDNDIIESVFSLKRKYGRDKIEKLLKETGVIQS
jgi:uncharacterized protein YwgA